jgi:hypothetical protein
MDRKIPGGQGKGQSIERATVKMRGGCKQTLYSLAISQTQIEGAWTRAGRDVSLLKLHQVKLSRIEEL